MEAATVGLTDFDEIVIDRALLLAGAHGVFEDDRFEDLFGTSREQFNAIAAVWPKVDVTDPRVKAAVIGSLTQLLFYPQVALVEQVLGCSTAGVAALRGRLLVAGWQDA
jgi:hypothetical protein